jgi:hypothetical protein
MDVVAKADLEIANGRLWRAKEILHKAVGHSGYKAEVFEKLGEVLLQMGDLAEAGKYLFLSGSMRMEHADAIGLFLKRYEGKPHNIFHPFPKSAKLSKISDYPEAVANELRKLGLPEDLKDINGVYIRPSQTIADKLMSVGCITFALIVIALMILGVLKLIELVTGHS